MNDRRRNLTPDPARDTCERNLKAEVHPTEGPLPGQVSAGMRAHRSEPLKSSFVPSRRRSPSCLRDSDPSTPALRANPCPEVTDPFCRLPLPTLFYRPEAVHLGDLLRIWVRRSARFHRSASLGFSRAGDRTRDSARAAELCGNIAVAPSLGANPFQAACDLTKKRELFPGLTTTSPRSLALPRLEGANPNHGLGVYAPEY